MSELVCKTLELLTETKGGFTSAVKNIFNTRTMATLKISELSVGDWVQNDYGDYVKVEGIWQGSNFNYQVDILRDGRTGTIVPCNLHPIPITAEILEKNGFEPSSSYWSIYKDGGGYIEIWEDEGRWYLSVNSVEFILCDLHWVHQIQHLMRVWGFDKEINL